MPDSHLITFAERLRQAREEPPVSTNNDPATDTELLDLADEAHPLKKRHCDWFIPAVVGFLLCPWTGICAIYYAVRGNCTSDLEKDEETVKRHNRRAKYLTFVSIVLGLIAIGSCVTVLLLIRQRVYDSTGYLEYEMENHLKRPGEVYSHDWATDNANTNEMQQTKWNSQGNNGENTNVYYNRDSDGDANDSESSEYSSDEDESKFKFASQDRREDQNSAHTYDNDDMNETYKYSTYNGYNEDYYVDETTKGNDTNTLNNDYKHDFENTYDTDTSSEDQTQYYDEYPPDPPNPYYQYDSSNDGQNPYDLPPENKPYVAYDNQQTRDEWPTYENIADEYNKDSEESNEYNNEVYYNANLPAGSYLAYYDDEADEIKTTEKPYLVNNGDGNDLSVPVQNLDSDSNENDYPYYQVSPSDNDDDEADSNERTFIDNNDVYMGKNRDALPTEMAGNDFYQNPVEIPEYQSQGYYNRNEDEYVSDQYPYYDNNGEEYPSETSSISDTPEAGDYNDTDITYQTFQQADAVNDNDTDIIDPTFQQDDYYDNVGEHDLSYYDDPVDVVPYSSNITEFTPAIQDADSNEQSAEDMGENFFYDDQAVPAMYESEDTGSEEEGVYDQHNLPIVLNSEEQEDEYLKKEEGNNQIKKQSSSVEDTGSEEESMYDQHNLPRVLSSEEQEDAYLKKEEGSNQIKKQTSSVEDTGSEENSMYDQHDLPIALSSEEQEYEYLNNEEGNNQIKKQTTSAMYEVWTTKPPLQYKLNTEGTTKRGIIKQSLWKKLGYKK